MEKDWVEVHSTSLSHVAGLIKSLLSENEIECVILNQKDSAYQVFGEIKVLVRRDKYVLAKNIISTTLGA